ncbi:hypothetical protein C5O80_05920 [Burkholderia sp. SRS-46]|nr:hypothetical protein C5O80_05920 [Burkholderia sp. SRS-46]
MHRSRKNRRGRDRDAGAAVSLLRASIGQAHGTSCVRIGRLDHLVELQLTVELFSVAEFRRRIAQTAQPGLQVRAAARIYDCVCAYAL